MNPQEWSYDNSILPFLIEALFSFGSQTVLKVNVIGRQEAGREGPVSTGLMNRPTSVVRHRLLAWTLLSRKETVY